jgi:hypothetical protein
MRKTRSLLTFADAAYADFTTTNERTSRGSTSNQDNAHDREEQTAPLLFVSPLCFQTTSMFPQFFYIKLPTFADAAYAYVTTVHVTASRGSTAAAALPVGIALAPAAAAAAAINRSSQQHVYRHLQMHRWPAADPRIASTVLSSPKRTAVHCCC